MEHDGELILADDADTSDSLLSQITDSLSAISSKNLGFLNRYFFHGLAPSEQDLSILKNPDKLGQLISMWDYIPRFVPDDTVVKLDALGVPQAYTRSGRTADFNYHFTLTPALIERKVTPARRKALIKANIPESQIKSKERVFVFPGLREDFVEEAMRLLSTEPPANGPSRLTMTASGLTLNFSLYEIRKALQSQRRDTGRHDASASDTDADSAEPKRRKNSRDMSYEAIREALHVLNGCKINLRVEAVRGPDRAIYESQTYESSYFTYLQLSEKRKKGDSSSAGQDTRCRVSFPPLLVGSIQEKFFRPYRVDVTAQLRTRLGREIYRWINLAHKNAQANKPIAVSMNQFLSDVSSRGVSVVKYDRRRFEEALEDLMQANVVTHHESTVTLANKGRAIVDVVYSLYLHPQALSGIIGANTYMKGHAQKKDEFMMRVRSSSRFAPSTQLPLFFDTPLPAAPTKARKEAIE